MSFKAIRDQAVVFTPAPGGAMATPIRTVLVEVSAAIFLVAGATALATSGDICLPSADVHPLWIPVLVFSARYGVRGMFIAVAMAALTLAGCSMVLHGGLVEVAARGTNPYDVIALVAATLVGWTAMIRDGRLARGSRERDEVARRLENSQETANALRDVVGMLRDRLDRIDLSISMWRTIAQRLHQGPLCDKAAAALELAAIRTGAATGVVQRIVGAHLTTIGTYGHGNVRGLDISRDRTIRQAVTRRRPALCGHVAGASVEDSEVAVPILDPEDGAVLGVLAMRDMPPARLRSAEVRDLEVVAAWLAETFPRRTQTAGGD